MARVTASSACHSVIDLTYSTHRTCYSSPAVMFNQQNFQVLCAWFLMCGLPYLALETAKFDLSAQPGSLLCIHPRAPAEVRAGSCAAGCSRPPVAAAVQATRRGTGSVPCKRSFKSDRFCVAASKCIRTANVDSCRNGVVFHSRSRNFQTFRVPALYTIHNLPLLDRCCLPVTIKQIATAEEESDGVYIINGSQIPQVFTIFVL